MIGGSAMWVKITFVTLVLSRLIGSCEEDYTNHSKEIKPKKKPNSEKNYVNEMLKKDTSKHRTNQEQVKVERYFYPQMSYCGGSLEGLYSNDELIRIESTYGYDMGYSEQNIDFNSGRITQIEYRKHYADWEKYNQHYGHENGDIDSKKMTYIDTLYILKFEPKPQFTIYSGKKRVYSKVSKALIDRLLDCTATMQKELNAERVKR